MSSSRIVTIPNVLTIVRMVLVPAFMIQTPPCFPSSGSPVVAFVAATLVLGPSPS